MGLSQRDGEGLIFGLREGIKNTVDRRPVNYFI